MPLKLTKSAAKNQAAEKHELIASSTDAGGPPVPAPDLREQLDELLLRGLSPTTALELLGLIIAWILNAPREDMERLKMVDKCLNTARGLMETRVKTEEAQAIAARLDELEERIESLIRPDR